MTPRPASRQLAEARLYLVAPARIDAGPLAELVAELAGAGVDLVQLREKELDGGDVLRLGRELADACAAAGIPFIVNDRPDIAALLGVGVHVGQDDLTVDQARHFVGDAIVGLSTHSEGQIEAAMNAAASPDYVAVGPVFETPTKPGRPAAGIGLVSYAARRLELPWFAIGGIDESNLDDVLDAGTRRIVVVRAITEARDPIAATARLRSRLDDAAR